MSPVWRQTFPSQLPVLMQSACHIVQLDGHLLPPTCAQRMFIQELKAWVQVFARQGTCADATPAHKNRMEQRTKSDLIIGLSPSCSGPRKDLLLHRTSLVGLRETLER